MENNELNQESIDVKSEDIKYLLKSFIKITKEVLLLKKIINNSRKIKEDKQLKIKMAKLAKIDEVCIPIFDGSNFSSWKFRLSTILEYKECNEQASRAATPNDNQDDWNKKDIKARAILIGTISDKQIEFIKDCRTAYDMMNRLESLYNTKSTSLQIINRNKIEQIKLKHYYIVEEFFADFEEAVNKFKAAGGEIEEKEKRNYLLKALPQDYSHIGDFIDVIPEAQQIIDNVKAK